jgi:hypothetical protein
LDETQIFLSYAHEDKEKVERILHALKAKNFPVFIDQDMPSGVDWEKVLKAKLQTAYAVVVVWSSHAMNSKWMAVEVAAGLEKDRLFPILIERGVTLPNSFSHKHAADLSNWNGDPTAPEFDAALSLLKLLWESQVGLLKDVEVRPPLRLKKNVL